MGKEVIVREFLTIIGLVLVLVLSAALIGPYFVNWDAERDVMAAHLTQELGRPVTISGPISLRLLPAPKLRLGALVLGGAADQSRFAARNVKLDLAVMPLLQGKFELTEAAFDHVRITLVETTSGAFDWPRPRAARWQSIALNALRLSNGKINLVHRDGTPMLTLEKLNMTAQAQSLQGPFGATGSVATSQGNLPFSLNTGQLTKHSLTIAWSSPALGVLPQAHFDGVVILGASAPKASGNLELTGAVRAKAFGRALPWNASMVLAADLQQVATTRLKLALGEGATALHATGTALINFLPQSHAAISLEAPQIDVDSMILARAAKPQPTIPVVTLDVAAWLTGSLRQPSVVFPLTVTVSTPLVNWGGDVLREVNARVQLEPAKPMQVHFATTAPAATKVMADGLVDRGQAAGFKGKLSASTDDAEALARWLRRLHEPPATALADGLQAQPFMHLGWHGPLEASRVSFASQRATIRLDRTKLVGAIAFTAAAGPKPARLFADFDAPALDIDAVPQETALSDAALDLDLTLKAHGVRVAHFGDGMIDAGDFRLRLKRSKGRLDLTQLKITNLDGANVTASGEVDSHGGAMQADVSATRLVEASALLARLFPGPLSAAWVARAPFLAPVQLHIAANRQAETAKNVSLLMTATINGTFAATKVTGSIAPSSRGLNANLVLKAPDAGPFLQQIGFAALPLQGLGNADVTLAMTQAGAAFQVQAKGAIAGTRVTATSSLQLGRKGLATDGELDVTSANLLPLTRALAFALPLDKPQLPFHMVAAVRGDDAGYDFRKVTGVVDGDTFSGNLHWHPAGNAPAVLSGTLDANRLTLPGLGALVLGAVPPGRSGLASGQVFGPAIDRLQSIGLHVTTPHFVTGLSDETAGPATFDLSLRHQTLKLDQFQGTLAGGKLSGHLTLARQGAMATLAGAASLTGAGLHLASLQTRLDGTMQVAATGKSPATLVANMAGVGTVTLHQPVVPKADQGAVSMLLRALGDDTSHMDAGHVGAVLKNALDKGPMQLPDQNLLATLTGGVLDLRPDGPDSRLHLSLDLNDNALKESLLLPAAAPPPLWSGAPPQIGISFSGPLSHPQRHIDMGALLDGLATRAIALQQAKIAAFNDDVAERAMFIRKLRGLRNMERNAADEKRFEVEREAAAAQKAKDAAADQRALLAAQKLMAKPPALSPPTAEIILKPLPPLQFQAPPPNAGSPLTLVPPAGAAPAH